MKKFITHEQAKCFTVAYQGVIQQKNKSKSKYKNQPLESFQWCLNICVRIGSSGSLSSVASPVKEDTVLASLGVINPKTKSAQWHSVINNPDGRDGFDTADEIYEKYGLDVPSQDKEPEAISILKKKYLVAAYEDVDSGRQTVIACVEGKGIYESFKVCTQVAQVIWAGCPYDSFVNKLLNKQQGDVFIHKRKKIRKIAAEPFENLSVADGIAVGEDFPKGLTLITM